MRRVFLIALALLGFAAPAAAFTVPPQSAVRWNGPQAQGPFEVQIQTLPDKTYIAHQQGCESQPRAYVLNSLTEPSGEQDKLLLTARPHFCRQPHIRFFNHADVAYTVRVRLD